MTDDLVKRLRLQSDLSLMKLPTDHVYVSHKAAADRIEELEKRVQQAKIVFATMRSEMASVCAVMEAFENE